MEVHHHAHHEHGKKNWKSYFWEFLMLFLAVFCGFLAEYQLEHVIEHQREKQFIVSMVKELEADRLQLKDVLQDTVRQKGIDSLLEIIYTGNINSIDVRRVYYLRRKYALNMMTMPFSRNTLTQLKNGGNMRLIRNRDVVDSLNQLDNFITQAEQQYSFTTDIYVTFLLLESGIFNGGFYRENGKRMPAEYVLNSTAEPVLMTKNYNEVVKYANMLGSWRGALKNYQQMLLVINNYSKNLISYLKKEYHLE